MTRAEKTPDRTRGHDGHSGSRPPRPVAPRRGRSWVWLVAALAAALVTVALAWFQPQKLVYSHRVSEPLPSVAAPPSGPSAPGSGTAAPAQPVQLAAGDFVSREHHTEGTARLLRLPDGRVIVRFEGFATSNGPVLVVWLSRNAAHGDANGFADGHVDLGPLKGNVGDQNYDVPADADAAAYSSVVVWCDRFDVPFGAADLHPST